MREHGARLVVLAAGGTGGHVFPAQALAAELEGRGLRLALVTDSRGGALGGTLAGVETHRVRAGGIAGKRWSQRLLSAPSLAFGTLQAGRLMRRLRPDVVVGFGGYASVPPMLAATFAGVRTAIHEQNAILGRANRLLATRVDRIATSFGTCGGVPAQAAGRVVATGMPVRPAVVARRGSPYPDLSGDGPIGLLVLGGSQGARVFSDVVPEAVRRLPAAWRNRLRIAQQCRREDLERTGGAYRAIKVTAELAPFFNDVPTRLAQAHLVVARAGASTVAELTAVGRPAILVPYPHAIDDHQTANAHAVDAVGAGWLMPEDGFTAEALATRLDSLLGAPQTLVTAAGCALAAGRPDAARCLADMVVTLIPNGDVKPGRQAA